MTIKARNNHDFIAEVVSANIESKYPKRNNPSIN